LASQPFASSPRDEPVRLAGWKLALPFLSDLIASEDELRHTSDRDHRRQRPLSDGRGPRADRAQDRHAVRAAVRHARWRRVKGASGLFFAKAWARRSNFAK